MIAGRGRLLVTAMVLASCQNGAAVGASCDRSSQCAPPLVCGHGRCRPACRENRDCGPGQRCFLEQDGTGTCSLDVESGCATSPIDHPCACDLGCHEDVCVAPCATSADCAGDGVCRFDATHAGTFCFATPGPDAGVIGDALGGCMGTDVCVDAPPAGWAGPVEVYQGATVPPCPSSTTMVLDGSSGLMAPDATCSTCTCGAAMGATCGATTATLFDGSVCGTTTCLTTSVAMACGPLKSMSQCTGAALVYMNFDSTQSGASCMPSPQTPTRTGPSWAEQVRACAPMGAATTCASGRVCAPSVPSAATCIYRSGNVPCPAGMYPTRTVMATSFVDSRGCSACACDPSSVTCGGGTVIVSQFATCSGGRPHPVPSTCAVDPFSSSSAFVAQTMVAATPSGSCTVVQSVATGAAVPMGETTICCP